MRTVMVCIKAQIPLCRLPHDVRDKSAINPVTSHLAQISLRRLLRNFPGRGSFGNRRNGIWAKGDVTGLSQTSRGSRRVEFGLKYFFVWGLRFLWTLTSVRNMINSAMIEAIAWDWFFGNSYAHQSLFFSSFSHNLLFRSVQQTKPVSTPYCVLRQKLHKKPTDLWLSLKYGKVTDFFAWSPCDFCTFTTVCTVKINA